MREKLSVTWYKDMLRVLMKLPLLSFKAMEEDDLQGGKKCDHACETAEIMPFFLSTLILMYVFTYTSTWVLLMRYSRG